MALWGSDAARAFIWPRISRSWDGGRVLSVREMASVQVKPGGISLPAGNGGRELACVPYALAAAPFVGFDVDCVIVLVS